MRIAYDHHAFCIQRYGGVSRYHVKLAEEIIKSDDEVKIFAPLHQNAYLNILPRDNISSIGCVEYKKYTKRLYMEANYHLSKILIRAWKPDVGHSTYYSSKSSFAGDTPTVVTIHDMIHEKFPQYFKQSYKVTENKRKTIERSQHVICISENTRNDLVNILNISPEKISVIYHGFEKKEIRNPVTYLGLNKPFILYVGGRGGHKNFISFVKAYSLSKRLQDNIGIIAFGGGDFSLDEKNIIISLGISNDNILHLSGDDDLLTALYKDATAFIYPSLYEGFGLPPLEAMANECPVISSNRSSMPEVIGGAGEYFNPEKIEEIKTAMENVVFSDTLRKQLIKKGQNRVKNFSWKKCALHTQEVYKKIVM